MSTVPMSITVQHVVAAFMALNLQGAKAPFDLGDETKVQAAATIYQRQLGHLNPQQLDAVVMAWGRHSTGLYGARWPTPGDLLNEAEVLSHASPRPRSIIDPGQEFRRLLSAAQAARSEAMGKVGEEHDNAKSSAWLRILAHRFGQAEDGRVLMPRALKAALVELGGLEGLLSIRDEFAQGKAQERFVRAYAVAARVIPLEVGRQELRLRAPAAPKLLTEHGRFEHPEVLAQDERHHERVGAWQRITELNNPEDAAEWLRGMMESEGGAEWWRTRGKP